MSIIFMTGVHRLYGNKRPKGATATQQGVFAKEHKRILPGFGVSPTSKARALFGARSMERNIQKDIPKHCLPVLSERSDYIGKRNKIVIGTFNAKLHKLGKVHVKGSDNN